MYNYSISLSYMHNIQCNYIFIYRPFISVHKRDIAFTSMDYITSEETCISVFPLKGGTCTMALSHPLVLLPHHIRGDMYIGWYMYHGTLPPFSLTLPSFNLNIFITLIEHC